ncbi:patatin-like phospholipase family protein [Pirellulaceae bacterium SH449]
MNNDEQSIPSQPMEHDAIDGQCASILDSELRRMAWAKRLDESTLFQLIHTAKVETFEADEVVMDVGSPISHVHFVVNGRFRVQLMDAHGRSRVNAVVVRGGAIGLLAYGCQESSLLRVEALEPSVSIRLTFDEIFELGTRSKEFQAAILELVSSLFSRVSAADRRLPMPSVVAVVHTSHRTSSLTTRLANRLAELEEDPCVFSDSPCEGLVDGIPCESLLTDKACISTQHRREKIKSWANRGRLLLNVQASQVGNDMIELLNYAEKVLWFVADGEEREATLAIERLTQEVPWVKEKLCVVWQLGSTHVAPWYPRLAELIDRDFKLSFDPRTRTEGKQLSSGLERVVHYLRGVQVGLALGGGAARGMAHLGVLQALEREGIVVDRLAGTSAGAMTGTIYSLGLDPTYATSCFKNDLLPSWFFRSLPGGGYWYLIYKYRRGLFEPMLRKYLRDYQLEQLPLPITSVSVDLVDGEPKVTSTGDATRSILESINLPPLSLPLFSEQSAIVDGGLLNNVPANVLVSQGCNFVIASTVTAKLDKDFMQIRQLGRPKRTLFSSVQVIMRQALVQSYSMNAIGVSPADFVIAPDVTEFDISAFTRADEMALVGERIVSDQIQSLKAQLRLLDSKLF